MSENLALYERVRRAPKEAQRMIEAGRLKGKTDINPMWRIKKLTEEFGPCGFGWYPEEKRKWTEPGANGEIAAFVDIDLYVKMNGEWSKPIHGTGGSMLVSKEKNGLYTDDEAFKKAYTDAISVACKELGFAADTYWEKDSTKYTPHTTKPSTGETGGDFDTKSDDDGLPKSLEEWKKVKVTKESLEAFGIDDPKTMLDYFEEKYGKHHFRFTREETASIWAQLWRNDKADE